MPSIKVEAGRDSHLENGDDGASFEAEKKSKESLQIPPQKLTNSPRKIFLSEKTPKFAPFAN